MAGSTPPPDKLQREIEELLGKLDTFVPEERLAEKRRRRRMERKASGEPTAFERARARLGRITLGQVMLAGLACMLVSFLFGGPLGDWARWLTILGIVLTGGAFVMSMMRGGNSRAPIGGRVQRRWRGQVIEYGEPTTFDRMRTWLRRRVRR